jgi:protoheme IX farnesyltransferase
MQRVSDYLNLIKLRLISLLLFVAIVSMVVAKGYSLSSKILFEMLILGFLGLSGSGILNNYFDRDVDAKMSRTSDRPIPAGRVSPQAALLTGIALVTISVVLSAIFLNLLTAFIIGSGSFLYLWLYTLRLKRRTPNAVVWGGLSGAIPALGGWAAVANSNWVVPILIFLTIFLWQPGHFWSLSMFVKEDYENVGIPVLPVLKGEKQVAKYAIVWNITVVPVTYLLYLFGDFTRFYLYAITVLNAWLIIFSLLCYFDNRKSVYRSSFRFSLVYMLMFLLALVVGRLLVS